MGKNNAEKVMPKKKGLSNLDFFTMGFGAIVGVGWALSINNWMASAGGPLAASAGYLLTLVLLIPIGLCYAELTPMMPVAGGNVAFAYRAFGQGTSFIAGWSAIGAFITLLPWEAIYINEILTMLFPQLKAGAPLYSVLGYSIHFRAIVVGLACVAALFLFNWKGAEASAKLQNVLCLLLIGSGLLTIIASLFKADASNLLPIYENVGAGTHTSFGGGVFAILASAPFFMCGFETIPQSAEEASDKTNSIGNIVVTVIVAASLFYALLLLCLGLAMPWQDFIKLPSPAVANMLRSLYGDPWGTVIAGIIVCGALFGLLTTWNAFLAATPRLMMGLSRASLIPFVFSRSHPRTGVPTVALIFCSLFAAAGPFLGISIVNVLTSFASAAFVLCWLITVCALIRLRLKEPDAPRPYKVPGGLAIPLFGAFSSTIVFVLFLVPGSVCYIGNTGVLMLIVWMALGGLLYFSTANSRAARSREEREAALFACGK